MIHDLIHIISEIYIYAYIPYIMQRHHMSFVFPSENWCVIHGDAGAQGIEEAKELCPNGSCT